MSLEFLNAFKFQKKNTIVHNLDPRAKLLLSIVYSISALLFTEIVPLFIIFLTLIPLILLGRMIKEWIRSIRGLSFLVLLIIVLNTYFLSLGYAIAMIIRITIIQRHSWTAIV